MSKKCSHQFLHGIVSEDQPLQVRDTVHKARINSAAHPTHITSPHIISPSTSSFHILTILGCCLLLAFSVSSTGETPPPYECHCQRGQQCRTGPVSARERCSIHNTTSECDRGYAHNNCHGVTATQLHPCVCVCRQHSSHNNQHATRVHSFSGHRVHPRQGLIHAPVPHMRMHPCHHNYPRTPAREWAVDAGAMQWPHTKEAPRFSMTAILLPSSSGEQQRAS